MTSSSVISKDQISLQLAETEIIIYFAMEAVCGYGDGPQI